MIALIISILIAATLLSALRVRKESTILMANGKSNHLSLFDWIVMVMVYAVLLAIAVYILDVILNSQLLIS